MLVSGTRDERIFAIAEAQRGIVSRRQLVAAGIAQSTVTRLASSGWLRRKHSGVFVTVPGASVEDPDGVRVHRSTVLKPLDIRGRARLPVISPPRVLLDLVNTIGTRETERAIDRMLIERAGTLGQIRELLARCGRHVGRAPLQDIVTGYTTSTFIRSEAEERFLALIRRSGLPQPFVNVKHLGFEIDFLWPNEAVAVEVDGFRFHSPRDRFEADRGRDSALRRAGSTVIRITWRQLEREPEAILVDVAQALARTAR